MTCILYELNPYITPSYQSRLIKRLHKIGLQSGIFQPLKASGYTLSKSKPSSQFLRFNQKQTTVSEINYTGSCDIAVGSSRYMQEAMNEAHEDHTRVSTRHINNPLFSTISTDSSLLDKYEIERISKDIERYLQFSCDKYYCGKSVDGVHVAGSRRIVPLMEKDSRGTKAKRTNTQRKWCRPMYELCGSIKGDVVENVCLATERRRQANKKHIPMAGDWNFHRNGA